MSSHAADHKAGRQRQRGATAIEFALVFAFFFMPLMIGMVDFSRWLFAVNSAVEATRYGARIATVCDPNAAGVKDRMKFVLPGGTPDTAITLDYLSGAANGCGSAGNVCAVRVTLTGVTIPKFAFFLPGSSYPIPPFATTLPRESLQTVVAGVANPLCS